MANDPVIEQARTDDLATVTELWVQLARGQRAYDSAVRAEPNRETMRETLAAHLHADGLLVARVDGTIVGFASVSIERGSLELDVTRGVLSNLYVSPEYRGRGIGTRLLEAATARLIEQGAEKIILEVMAENQAARRFYRERGFSTFRIGMSRPVDDRSENDTHSKEDG